MFARHRLPQLWRHGGRDDVATGSPQPAQGMLGISDLIRWAWRNELSDDAAPLRDGNGLAGPLHVVKDGQALGLEEGCLAFITLYDHIGSVKPAMRDSNKK